MMGDGLLALWSADQAGRTIASVPDFSLWTTSGCIAADGYADPYGGTTATRVLENEGGSWPYIHAINVDENYAVSPVVLSFAWKSIGGRCLYILSSVEATMIRLESDGSITKLNADLYGADSVQWRRTELTYGWSQYTFWVGNACAVRTGVLFASGDDVAWAHAPNDPHAGWYLCPVPGVPVVVQDHALTVADSSGHGFDLTSSLLDALNYQAADGTSHFPHWLPGRAVLWAADRPMHKQLSGAHPELNAALSGTAPVTVMLLVRFLVNSNPEPDAWFAAVASEGNNFELGVDASGLDTSPHAYAGVLGVTGAQATEEERFPMECWRVVAAVRSDGQVTIYDCTDDIELIAAPAPVSTGMIASVQIGAITAAVREWRVFGKALDAAALARQAQDLVDSAGGSAAIERYVTHDEIEIRTYPNSVPWPYTDDAGACYFKDASWRLGGAVYRGTPGNAVYRSFDDGRTWQQVAQVVPFTASTAVAAWAMTIGGTDYMYVGTCGPVGAELFRTVDGATWVKTTTGAEEFFNHQQGSWAVLDGAIYHLFGQTNLADGNTATPHVFRSIDGGFTFTKLTDFPGVARAELCRLIPEFDGKLHIVHGGRWSSPGVLVTVYNDHWMFDGTNWVEVESVTAPPGAIWETLWATASDLWLRSGFVPIPGSSYRNQRTLWRWNSTDGWRDAVVAAFSFDHASTAIVLPNGDAVIAGGDFSGNTTRVIKGPS